MKNPSVVRSRSHRLAGAVLLLGSVAHAQLTPDRIYYGVDRAVPMTVAIPADTKGEATIQFFAPDGKEPTAKAPVVGGAVDLAKAIPDFWKSATTLKYAQLVVGEKKIGSAVVLQPLKNPPIAALNERGGVMFHGNPDGQGFSGIRAYAEKHIVMNTTLGEIEFRLRPDHAPNTCWSISELVRGGLYTDIIFHRIMGDKNGGGFMAQCGDPTGTGGGGPGFNIDFENSKLPHDFGVLSMARGDDPNTGGSQFFICFSRFGTQMLDGGYVAYAQAVRGAEAIVALTKVETVLANPGAPRPEYSKPVNPPKLISATLIPAPPFGEAPAPVAPPVAQPAAR
jgi:cyclophilin family peptidyl-prolyl cis-trans isomerase